MKAATLSFALAMLAGTTVSQARQQQQPNTATPSERPAASSSESAGSPAGTSSTASAPTLKIHLIADGNARTVNAPVHSTVSALLKQENVALDNLDRCSSSLSTVLKDGMEVRVARIHQTTTIERTPIPFSTRSKYVGTLPIGTKQVVTAGKNGERLVTYRDLWKDGKRTDRTRVSQTYTAPRTQVVLQGVRGMTLASRGYFSGKRLVEMVATGYGPGENGRWGAHTASGLRPGRGVVAVDPRFIPLGTRLYVEGYGYCVAGDTGGAIKGNRIDLGMDSYHEAADVGRKRVRVLIMD